MNASRPLSTPAPIIVDLGARKRKAIKALARGQGPLLDDVDEVIAQVRSELGAEAKDALLVPVIVVYKRKPKRAVGGLGGLL